MRNAAFILSLKELAAEYNTIGQALFEQANAIATYPKHDPGDRLYSLDRIAERSTVQLRHLAARAAPEQKSAFYAGLPSLLGISVEEKKVTADISVVLCYGCKIPEVTAALQDKVKGAIESMTGLEVDNVNVHIVDVKLEEE